jgi:hypothetical protein
MKNTVYFFLLFTILLGCSKSNTAIDPVLVDRKTPGEWAAAQGGAGGFNNTESFKNFQFTVEIGSANQVVNIGLISASIDVQYALFDPLGQRLDISAQSRSTIKPYTLKAGKYRIVVMADRQAVGKFELTTLGVNGDPVRIPSDLLQSNTQNWGPLGGGGRDFTFKNHFYTFDITDDNSTTDIELLSADTDVAIYLFNSLGQEVAAATGGRYRFLLRAVKKGTYTVMAATNVRAAVGNYQLNIFGKVANLKRIESQLVQSGTQNWGPLGGGGSVKTFKNHFYTVDITEDNTPVDFTLESTNVDVEMLIYNTLGQVIASFNGNSRYRFKVLDLKKGNYTVMATTNVRGGVGNYQLSIVGKVANLKRVDSQAATVTGRWADKNATDTYTIQLTADTSPLDIELVSPDTNAFFELQTGAGNRIALSSSTPSKNEFLVRQDMAKGSYRILVSPSRNSGSAGNYTLTVHGQFSDFKKL